MELVNDLRARRWRGDETGWELETRSPVMARLLEQARGYAQFGDDPILISGPIGSGKSHLARYIHRASPRAAEPLVVIDCGGLPDLANTLFGHRSGSFTGAVKDLGGRFKEADGGILVLDDLERLGAQHQDQLHRILVDGTYYPVGADRPSRVNVRFIATTNKDVRDEVEAGRLKRDFVSRLDYFELHVPPLHRRPEDVPALCEELLRRAKAKGPQPSQRKIQFHDDCWPAIQARQFDDNVRGLEKLVSRLIVQLAGRELITPGDVEAVAPIAPAAIGLGFEMPTSLRAVRDAAEKRYILEVCRLTRFNLRHAARILGISPKGLYSKLRLYGIRRP